MMESLDSLIQTILTDILDEVRSKYDIQTETLVIHTWFKSLWAIYGIRRRIKHSLRFPFKK